MSAKLKTIWCKCHQLSFTFVYFAFALLIIVSIKKSRNNFVNIPWYIVNLTIKSTFVILFCTVIRNFNDLVSSSLLFQCLFIFFLSINFLLNSFLIKPRCNCVVQYTSDFTGAHSPRMDISDMLQVEKKNTFQWSKTIPALPWGPSYKDVPIKVWKQRDKKNIAWYLKQTIKCWKLIAVR